MIMFNQTPVVIVVIKFCPIILITLNYCRFYWVLLVVFFSASKSFGQALSNAKVLREYKLSDWNSCNWCQFMCSNFLYNCSALTEKQLIKVSSISVDLTGFINWFSRDSCFIQTVYSINGFATSAIFSRVINE